MAEVVYDPGSIRHQAIAQIQNLSIIIFQWPCTEMLMIVYKVLL